MLRSMYAAARVERGLSGEWSGGRGSKGARERVWDVQGILAELCPEEARPGQPSAKSASAAQARPSHQTHFELDLVFKSTILS